MTLVSTPSTFLDMIGTKNERRYCPDQCHPQRIKYRARSQIAQIVVHLRPHFKTPKK